MNSRSDHLRRLLSAILFIVMMALTAAQNYLAAQDGNHPDAAKMLRHGRDLIEQEKWAAAEQSYKEFMSYYPRHRDVDAALYWLAFSLKKQGRLPDADRTLEQLIRDHPQSGWSDDARAMRVEMAPQLGNQTVINQALDESADKSDDEMKAVALQSLIFSNSESAFSKLRDILKPDSKAHKNLKQMAITLLGQQGKAGIDVLLDVARNQPDKDLRHTAMFWLGMSGDDRAFEFLKDVVTKSDDKELARSALAGLTQSRNPKAQPLLAEIARSSPSAELRQTAIMQLGIHNSDAAVDELLHLYDAESNVELKKQVLTALAIGGNSRGLAKLWEVARGDANTELRKGAVFWLAQRGGESTIVRLIQMFDTEQDEGIKEQFIFALSQSRSKTAVQKLMQIARSSPSLALRKRAIFWLGQNPDPEVTKFLEEILNQRKDGNLQ